MVGKSSLQELANLGDYPGDFVLQSEDRDIQPKSGVSRIIQESSQRCSSVTLGLWLFVFGQ